MRRLLVTASLVALGISFGTGGSASAMINPLRSGTASSATSGVSPLHCGRRCCSPRYRQVRHQPGPGEGRRVPDHYPHDAGMGYQVMNPAVKGFDLTRPPILVYEHTGSGWQLGALEWVFTSKPATPPLPGAQYGAFGAACHYVDGTFVYASSESKCAPTSPQTGAKFNFWHPNLVTLHFWVWYPNSAGIYSGLNPLVAPFNAS